MEFKKIVVPDLFSENEVLNFPYPETTWIHQGIPRLGIVSFLTVDTNMDRDLAAMHARCVEEAEHTIWQAGWNSYLFFADAPWQPKSVMVRYKRLWKRNPIVQGFNSDQLSEEVMVESSEGLRFGGMVRLTKDSFSLASKIVWEEPHGAFLVLSRTGEYMNVSTIRRRMDIAFHEPKGKSAHRVDLSNLCLQVCPRGDAIGRVSGDWDSRDVSIDLIMTPECLEEFRA